MMYKYMLYDWGAVSNYQVNARTQLHMAKVVGCPSLVQFWNRKLYEEEHGA